MRRGITTAAALTGVVGISAGFLGVGTARAADLDRKAVCADTACLVLVKSIDSDGDGVSDIDEIALRTDPRDAVRMPPADVLLSQALLRTLPSFELGETIVVALPTLDGNLGVDLFGKQVKVGATESALAALRADIEHDGVAALSGRSAHALDALALFDAALQSGTDMRGLLWSFAPELGRMLETGASGVMPELAGANNDSWYAAGYYVVTGPPQVIGPETWVVETWYDEDGTELFSELEVHERL